MDFSEQSHIKGEVHIYQIVLPLSDSMYVSTFSKFLCQSHVTADRTNPRYIYIERFNNIQLWPSEELNIQNCQPTRVIFPRADIHRFRGS